jgi:MFS family permease
VRGLPRAFWFLVTAALIDRIGGFAQVYLAIYLTTKVSVAMAGVMVSLLSLGGLAGGPLGGALADRLGRKPVIMGGLLFTACSWLNVAHADGLVFTGASLVLAGFASSLARPAMAAAIGDVVPESERRRAYGYHYWAINLGFAVAASVAGALSRVSWNLVFGLDALSSVVAAAFLWFAMRHVKPKAAPATGTSALGWRDLVTGPFRDGVFMLLVLQGVMNSSMFMQLSVPLATEMKSHGLEALYGPITAINGILIVLLQPTVTQLASRARTSWVLGLGCFLVGLGFFLTAFCSAWWQFGGSIAVWTLGEILLASTMPAVIAKLAPPDRRATYQGLFQMSWSVSAFAPALGAFILEGAGSLALWSLCLVGGLVGVFIQVRLSRSPRM